VKAAVIGCGYVGLVTAVGFATAGHEVVAIEKDGDRLAAIRSGRAPFHEPGLEAALAAALKSGALRTSSVMADVADAEVILIAVGTPSAADGAADLTGLQAAAEELAAALPDTDQYQVVVVRSTVPPGSTRNVVLPRLACCRKWSRAALGVAMVPEFLREGSAWADFFQPDRIVIGALDERAQSVVARFYGHPGCPVFLTTLETAELVKYSSNALLATLVSFSNEVARVAEQLPGVDTEVVMKALHADRRFTTVVEGKRVTAEASTYLRPGCGYGGSCLPKDLKGFIHFAGRLGVETSLLRAVDEVNRTQPEHFVQAAERSIGDLTGRSALVLGLGFKAGTDDIRESPGIDLARTLLRRGARVFVSDPLVRREQLKELLAAGAGFVADPQAFFRECDVCFITTLAPEFGFVADVLDRSDGDHPFVVDGRRALFSDRKTLPAKYLAIGVGVR